jgi:hypothetical protein
VNAPRRHRSRQIPAPIITPAAYKVVASFSLPLDDWPPPGELEEALKAASDAFVHVLRIALEEKLRGNIIADLDCAPPYSDLN